LQREHDALFVFAERCDAVPEFVPVEQHDCSGVGDDAKFFSLTRRIVFVELAHEAAARALN
jgi:hypothetical protein